MPNGASENANQESSPGSSSPRADAVSGSPAGRLASIWAEALGIEHVAPDASFFDLGGDSVAAARVLAAVEAEFGKRLTIASMFRFPTVAQMAETLGGDGEVARPASLVLIQAGDEKPPLFYAPGATAGDTVLLGYSAYLSRLAHRLGNQQTVYSLYQEYAGPATSVETVAANLVRDIRAVQPSGPYHLGGWSLGGLVVFEMARQLTASGEDVALVALFDTTGPGDTWRKTRNGRIAAAMHAWRELPLADKFTHPTAGLRGLMHRGARRVRGKVERLAANKATEDPWSRAKHIARIYLSRPHAYSGRLTLFTSDETILAIQDDVALAGDPHLGWSAVAGSVEVFKLPGDHYTMFDEPGITEMVGILRGRLPTHHGTGNASVPEGI